MEAKWQLSPSHVQVSLAWIQIPRCKITQCFSWISSQLQALTMPDQHAAVTFFFVCVMPLCGIGTKRGFIHHFLSLCAASTNTALRLSCRLAESVWIRVFLVSGRHMLLTEPEKNLQAAPVFHADCVWCLMTPLLQFGFVMQSTGGYLIS